MKFIVRATICVLFIIALAACTLELPTPVSATAERYSKGAPVQTWKLSERQVGSLAEWFTQHQGGWLPSYVSYAPAVNIRILHAGGKQSYVNVWSSTKVVVNSGGSQVEQQFEAPDVQSLLTIIEAHGG